MDDLELFLATRDAEKVSREWHVVKDIDALQMERPKMSVPRRNRKYRSRITLTFSERRTQRMMDEVLARDRES